MLPPGYRMRGPEPGDAAHVVAIVNDEARTIAGAVTVDVDRLERMWSSPGVDRERDVALVVNDADVVCAMLYCSCQAPYLRVRFRGAVRRADHHQGIGGALVAEAAVRGSRFRGLAGGAPQVLQGFTFVGDRRTDSLMTAAGFRPVRYFLEMERVFSEVREPAGVVDGVVIRPYRSSDIEAVHACIATAFDDHWGDPEPSFEEWRRGVDDTSFWSVALVDDAIVGVVSAAGGRPSDGERGYVGELGVLPSWRGRGVGEALLRTAFRSIEAAGLPAVCLHVDGASLTGATRLYERVGMRARPSYMWWERAFDGTNAVRCDRWTSP